MLPFFKFYGSNIVASRNYWNIRTTLRPFGYAQGAKG